MGAPQMADLATAIAQIVTAQDFGEANAAKRGRNPRWPYVPVIHHARPNSSTRTEQIVPMAFATRAEAVEYAAKVIEARREHLRSQLAEPRHRALREKYGLPRDIPRSLAECA
jgi:hypothetical protein